MKRLILIPMLLATPWLSAAETAKKSVPPVSLESRIERLERVLSGKALVDMQLRMEQLQQEVQQLRGELEQQNHQIKEIKDHQRDLYADIDRRLLALERGGAGNGTAAGNNSAADTEEAAQPPSQGEQQAYQQGIDLLQEFKYAQAARSFAAYLKAYPQGRYAPIARYWLADSYYSDRKYKEAIGQYQRLLKDYPDNSKAVQARLKIGYSQAELKQWKGARDSMETVIKLHPNSTEASLAQRYLQRLKQQGH
ncbi:MAG: tol-pal system protein YbgF [Gammaproteobacteria bacterium]|nr:tol-pal system protein YbgF [Gammaproteobacteria bacterium]